MKWISVNNGLPKNSAPVFVFWGVPTMAHYSKKHQRWFHNCCTACKCRSKNEYKCTFEDLVGYGDSGQPTHWMEPIEFPTEEK